MMPLFGQVEKFLLGGDPPVKPCREVSLSWVST
jgi:hypothetical protein